MFGKYCKQKELFRLGIRDASLVLGSELRVTGYKWLGKVLLLYLMCWLLVLSLGLWVMGYGF
jgi:hypothetical protein